MKYSNICLNRTANRRSIKAAEHFPINKVKFRLTILFVLFILIFIVSFSIGRFYVPVNQVFRILLSQIIPLPHNWPASMEIVILHVRLPRIAAAALIGIALSAGGSVYQGMFNNPMISPDILGSSSGAGFGAALGIFMGLSSFGINIISFFIGTFAVLTTAFVSSRYRSNQTLGLVLAGIMVSSLFSAAISYIKLVADPTDELPAITYWLMGSLASIRNHDLLLLTPAVLIGLIPLLLMRWHLNVITLGDEEARSLGVNTKRLRFTVIVFATLMTSACVAVSGMIGWVGLVIPHFARKLIGCDYKYLLPASILMGGSFLMIVDNISRTAATVEIPIGILTAFVGAPFFLSMLLKEGGT